MLMGRYLLLICTAAHWAAKSFIYALVIENAIVCNCRHLRITCIDVIGRITVGPMQGCVFAPGCKSFIFNL